jgi:hypothetical protein
MEGNMLLQQIVTGDGTWCYHFEPTGKPASMQSKKFKSLLSAGEMTFTVLVHVQKLLLLDFKWWNDTISVNCCCQVLQNLYTKVENNCPGKFTDSIILQHNSVCPHMAHRVQDQLNAMR